MTSSLLDEAEGLLARLSEANQAHAARWPGEPGGRQPVHTVYGGAHLYRAETPRKLGDLALRTMQTYAPDASAFARALGLPASLAQSVYRRVVDKLEREPVEDLRIDFEDGFGPRSDAEEDEAARRAAGELARALDASLVPPFVGIRIKALGDQTARRAVRTLDLFTTTLLEASDGHLPPGFVVTLPKVAHPQQVATLVGLLERLEVRLGVASGGLRIEIMVELPQALLDAQGRSALPQLLEAAQRRCVGVHLGAYDLTAACNITAAHQRIDHPVCELARHQMLLAFAGAGVFLSDGAIHVMPIGPHRGASLSAAQRAENERVVHDAWRQFYGHARRALESGFYQGWDLHPAQLPVRFAACHAFFLEGFAQAAERLRNFLEHAAWASRVGVHFDDAASAQGLLTFFRRALASGALTPDEAAAATGLTAEALQTRSFEALAAARLQATTSTASSMD